MNNEVCVYAFHEWVRYLEFRETPTKQGGARQSGFASPIVPKYHQHIVLSSSIVTFLSSHTTSSKLHSLGLLKGR